MIEDTPSIIHREIASARIGQTLKYSELTGAEKRDYLFEHGVRPTAYGPAGRPDVVSGLLQFSRSAIQSIAHHLLSATLTRVDDELDPPKRKLFHTYGSVAKITFTPEPNTPYTGILSERARGLARFSYAGPVAGIGVVPGLALKFPIDGEHASENLVVMRKLDRQQPLRRFLSLHSHNSVFQNPFTNILPAPRATNLIMRAVQHRFETVVQRGRGLHQPAENLAAINVNGNTVAKPAAPYRLIFCPTAAAAACSDPTVDFRDDLARNIGAGTAIYDILALTEAQEMDLNQNGIDGVEGMLPHAKKIGAVTTDSEFIASSYGDYRLFFQHNARFIRDEFKP